MADPLYSVVYLKVRKRRVGGWSGRELIARAYDRPPKVGPGEYVLRLRVSVPEKCLSQTSGYIDVKAAQPGEAAAEVEE